MFGSKPQDLTTEQRNDLLFAYLDLSADALNHNKQGQLSDAQRARFTDMAQQGTIAYILLGPIIMVVAIVLIAVQITPEFLDGLDQNARMMMVAGIGGSFLLYAVLLVYAVWRGWKGRAIIHDGLTIESITGKLKINRIDDHYVTLNIDRTPIYIRDSQVENAFIENTIYCVYYFKTDRLRTFVSAEAV